MGWGVRLVAGFVMQILLLLGAWPISMIIFLYLVLSSRRPHVHTDYVQREDALVKPGRPWGRYAFGSFMLLLAAVAFESGGTFSPLLFFAGGIVAFGWPLIGRAGFTSRVVPVRGSVLLRSRLFPFAWHALAEVKLESQDQTRGLASMGGKLLLFAGKSPSVYKVVDAYAFGYRQAEDRIIKEL